MTTTDTTDWSPADAARERERLQSYERRTGQVRPRSPQTIAAERERQFTTLQSSLSRLASQERRRPRPTAPAAQPKSSTNGAGAQPKPTRSVRLSDLRQAQAAAGLAASGQMVDRTAELLGQRLMAQGGIRLNPHLHWQDCLRRGLPL